MKSQELPVKGEPKPRRRPRWRLRILLAVGVLVGALLVISRLEPDEAKKYGPIIESVYLVFNPPIEDELSAAGKQFIDEIIALGGQAGRMQPERKFFGLMDADEKFVVGFSGAKFDDPAFERLATEHGDRIGGLNLFDTSVTDDGLKHLKRFGNLRSLILMSSAPVWVNGKKMTPITDAGMAHLDLRNLVMLNLDGLPITDAGLKSLPDLPFLSTLQLTGSQVEGPGLGRLAAFRNLASLHLNNSAVTDEGLSHLAGAKSLVVLFLDGMPLTRAGLKHVITLPHLSYLSIRGCQVPGEDVSEMKAKAPALRIER
jgi:Leucine Rich repeat